MQKQEQPADADRMLWKALLPSVLGMIICVILLCGTTFAWFTDSVHTSGSKITAGNFSVNLIVNGTLVPEAHAVLPGAGEYTVRVEKGGNAKGYAILSLPSETYLISVFPAVVKIKTSQNITVSVTPFWGNDPPSYTKLPAELTLE